MQYAEHLPNPRRMVAPAVALVIGAAAATGAYALLDSEQVELPAPKVIVTETPAQPSQGVAAKHEAATAAAIGGSAASSSFGKDEAASATAIGRGAAISGSSGAETKDEAASATAIGRGAAISGSSGAETKDEAATAAAIGNGVEVRGSKASAAGSSTSLSEEAETARRTDPHGPASALP
jgi:hypothetical protein